MSTWADMARIEREAGVRLIDLDWSLDGLVVEVWAEGAGVIGTYVPRVGSLWLEGWIAPRTGNADGIIEMVNDWKGAQA